MNAQVNKTPVNREKREDIIRDRRNRRETLRDNDSYKIPCNQID